MSPVIHASCHCRRLAVEATLTRPLHDYAPRACDCEFCTRHGAAWLTDPAGRLRMRQQDGNAALHYRHGSDQAEFIACASCAVLVLATYQNDGRLYAALNARTVEGAPGFAPEQTAQPRLLPAAEKATRWQQLWFGDVRIETA